MKEQTPPSGPAVPTAPAAPLPVMPKTLPTIPIDEETPELPAATPIGLQWKGKKPDFAQNLEQAKAVHTQDLSEAQLNSVFRSFRLANESAVQAPQAAAAYAKAATIQPGPNTTVIATSRPSSVTETYPEPDISRQEDDIRKQAGYSYAMDIQVRLVNGSQGKLVCGSLEFDCALGKTGITKEKREGGHATPAGRYLLRWVFYRADKTPDIQSLRPQQQISTFDGWCDAPDHEHYNRYVRLPFEHGHEKPWRDDDLYDLVIVPGHNDSPAVPGAGSCIFLHVAHGQHEPTEGCVALKKTDLIELLAEPDPECRIGIAPAD